MEPSALVPPPAGRKMNRWVAMAIAVVAVIVALVLAFQVAVPAVPRTMAQPSIILTNGEQTCRSSGVSPAVIGLAFNLTNRGDADGYAEVLIRLSGLEVRRDTYFVPAGTVVHKSQDVVTRDNCIFVTCVGGPCPGGISAEITRTWKA